MPISTRSAVIGTVLCFAVATFYLTRSPPSALFSTMSSPINTPTVTLSTISARPPTLRITLHNPSSRPMTFIRYHSPLDPLALSLGLVRVTALDGKEVPIVTINPNRVWPPEAEDVVELAPGSTANQDVELSEPVVELESGKNYLVRVDGSGMGVWNKGKNNVTHAELESAGAVDSRVRWWSENIVLAT